jgi:hypothetical protein
VDTYLPGKPGEVYIARRFPAAPRSVPRERVLFARHSYNNPVKYSDPSGHWVCEDAEGCYGQSPPPWPGGNGGPAPSPNLAEPLHRQSPSNGGVPSWYPYLAVASRQFGWSESYGGPIVIDLGTDIHLAIMPPGYSPSPAGAIDEERASNYAYLGAVMDEAELVLIASPMEMNLGEDTVAAGDVIVTYAHCYFAGECYYSQPHPDLPPLFTVNQDIIATGGDLIAPFLPGAVGGVIAGGPGFAFAKELTDAATTGLSLRYDLGRISGSKNYLSAGVEIRSGELFILLYPW